LVTFGRQQKVIPRGEQLIAGKACNNKKTRQSDYQAAFIIGTRQGKDKTAGFNPPSLLPQSFCQDKKPAPSRREPS
jgi:hypothetical protein